MENSTTSPVDWGDALTGQVLSFNVLAKLIYVYPEIQWIESLIAEDIFVDVPFASAQPEVVAGLSLLQTWCGANRGGLTLEAFDALRVDYTRLFIGPGKLLAPPWESIAFCEEQLVFQRETLEVREWYARYGLELINLHKEPDDHIGLELEFIAHLAKLGLQALEANDSKRFHELLDAQRQFLTEHPLRWAMEWANLVEQNAYTEFYRGVALLARGSLIELAMLLAVPLPQIAKS
jgi:putative dimethyl sulfoxide reductase chaperone